MNSARTSRGASPPDAEERPWAELRISLLYILCASLWIVLSDEALDYFTGDPVDTLPLQTYKGLNFVLTTGVLLYWVLHRSYTRRRNAERQSHEVTERFELVARTSTDAIFDLNLQTRSIWWNEGLENLFGYPVESASGRLDVWTSHLHPQDRERVTAGFERILKSTADVWADEFRFQRRDGGYAEVVARAHVMRDPDGTAVRLVGGFSDVTQRKQAEAKLHRSRQQLRGLSVRLQSLREEERSRIAREIHDQLGQMLTAMKMDLRWIEKRLGAQEDHPALNPILDKAVEAGELADATLATVHAIVSELRPGVLEELGLAAALQHEAGRFQQRSEILCEFHAAAALPALSRERATAAFRIFQETLTNVARHAQATKVEIRLDELEGGLVLEVRDNGRGISPAALEDSRSFGLVGMKERAAAFGGEVSFEPLAGGGTAMRLRLPLGTEKAGTKSKL